MVICQTASHTRLGQNYAPERTPGLQEGALYVGGGIFTTRAGWGLFAARKMKFFLLELF